MIDNYNNNNLLDANFLIDKIVSSDNLKIADLGSGSFGYFTFSLAKRIGPHGKIYAVDVVKSNLETIERMAKTENLDQIKTIWSDLEVYRGTNIPDNFLDSVLLISILHQSNKYLDIFKETLRMTKVGGKILVVEWNEKDALFSTKNKIDKERLKKEIKNFPVDLVEEFFPSKYHYGLLLIKNK